MNTPHWQRVGAIFDEVVDLAANKRCAALDALCAADSAERREVERMLAAVERQGAFERDVDTTRHQLAADWVRDTEIEAGICVGARIGVWRVVREIGRGGMGVVLLAERADKEFEQKVALKLLAYPTVGLLQRFRQERRILARLEHPNIARLIDGGLTASNIPYFVMEHVEGKPIVQYCRDGRLNLPDRLTLFATVCMAVQYAHQNLVIHRDLKPSNILVSPGGVSKLLDFGVAKLLESNEDSDSTHTAAQLFTADYAAPEQLRGEAVTTATDVYALGVVLYELLVGSRPRHVKGGHLSSSQAAFANDPVAPSVALGQDSDLAPARRAIRGDLDRIVLRALAAEPKRRYASVQIFLGDLRNYLEGRPVSATADRWQYRLQKFARRHRFGVAAGTLLVAICLAGVAGVAWEARKTREQAVNASIEARNALEQAQRANAVREFMIDVLGQARPDATQGRPIVAHELLDNAANQLAKYVDVPHAVRADLLDVLGTLYFDVGDFERSEILLRQAVAESDNGVPTEVRARALLDLAGTTWRKGAYPLAREYLHESLALTQSSNTSNEQLVSSIRHMLDAVEVEASGASAEPVVRATLQYDRSAFGENSDQAERDWETLAWVLLRSRKYDEMYAAIDRALSIARAQHGERHTTVASALEALGNAQIANLDFFGAERTFSKALDIDNLILGASHPNTLRMQWGYLSALAEQGRFADVLPRHIQNLARQKEVLGANNSTVALTQASIGETQRELGQFSAAEDSLHEAARIWTAIDSASGPELSNVQTDLGSVYFLEGRYAQAEVALREALATARKYFPEHSLRVRRVLFWLAKTLMREGRHQEAIALIEPIVATLRASADPQAAAERYDLQYSLNVLAEAQLIANMPEAALVSAQSAHDLITSLFPQGSYKLGTSLLLIGMSRAASKQYAEAETAIRASIGIRGNAYAATDPRLIEPKLALGELLLAQGKGNEARIAIAAIPSALSGSPYPGDVKLKARALAMLAAAAR
jgi:eukaryotic-like serine/threonine-protein kinase